MERPQPQKRVTIVASWKSCLCAVPSLGSGLSCDHVNQKWDCASGQTSCKKNWQFLFLLLDDPALPCKKSGYSAGETMWKGSVELPKPWDYEKREREREWVPSSSAQTLCQLNADTLWPLASPYWANKMVIVLSHPVLGGLYLAINYQNTTTSATYLQAWARSLASGAATARAATAMAAATAWLASASTAKGSSALWITPSPTALKFLFSTSLLLAGAGALESFLTGAPWPFLLIPSPNRNLCRPFPAFGAPSWKPGPCLCVHTRSQLQTVSPVLERWPGKWVAGIFCWNLEQIFL